MFQRSSRMSWSCFGISSRYLRVLGFILTLIYYSGHKYWLQKYFKENIEAICNFHANCTAVFVCSFILSKSSGRNNAKYAFQYTFKNNTTQYAKKKKRRQNKVGTFTIQGGKTFCARLCASHHRLKAGFSDCVCLSSCLSLREFWLSLNEIHEVRTFAPLQAFLFVCVFVFFFPSLENYLGFRTTNLTGKNGSFRQFEVE